MATKPPIFHPYTTNTGQVLLSDLVLYPRSSVLFAFTSSGGGVPTVPVQIIAEAVEEGLVLLVYPELPVLVNYSDTLIPIIPIDTTPQLGTMYLAANQYHLIQWPSQYFTPIPLTAPTEDANILVNILWPQNSAGDSYKWENR